MSTGDDSDGRYQIEFSTDQPGFIENVATFGAATVIQKGADAVFGEGHGWYCKITDRTTGLWDSHWGATKGEAQEATFYELKRKIAGFLDDQANERARQEDQDARRRSEQRERTHESSDGDSSGSEAIGKLIGVVIIGIAIIWFVFSVAIPLFVINIAVIALITATVRKQWRKLLLPVSIFGAALVFADYNNGWSTAKLVNSLSFFSGFIPVFLYANLGAGLIAAYLLIRDFLDGRNAPPESAGEFSRRNMVAMGGLILLGGATVAAQVHTDSIRLAASPQSNRPAGFVQVQSVPGAPRVEGSRPSPQPAQQGASLTSKRSIRIGMIATNGMDPEFVAAHMGAEAAAAELSKTTGVAVSIDWVSGSAGGAQAQAQRIAQAVSNGDDAMLISAGDASTVVGAIDAAVDRGIPVMMFNSDAPGSKRFSFYGADDAAIGRQVMAVLAQQLGGKGRIAVLAGNQNSPSLQKRVAAVKEEAAKYPGITLLEPHYHAETPEDAAAEVIRSQSADPDITGWAMVGGWALMTPTLLTKLDPKRVKIVAMGALPVEMPYIESGLAPVLLAQPSYLWGDISVRMTYDHVYLNKEVPQQPSMALVPVSIANLGGWARQLKIWGFTGIDPKYLALPQ